MHHRRDGDGLLLHAVDQSKVVNEELAGGLIYELGYDTAGERVLGESACTGDQFADDGCRMVG